jgi:hypothetical protein
MLALVRAKEQSLERQAERDYQRRDDGTYTGPMLGEMLTQREST